MSKVKLKDLAKLSTGAYLINHQLKKGNLTGRERVYHNTDRKNIRSIKSRGILASKALDPKNLTHSASGDFLTDEDMEGLTYVARKRTPALGVAIATGNRKIANPESEYHKDPVGAYMSRKTVKADIPVWKMETTDNPELGGASNQHELKKVLDERWRRRADDRYGNSIANKVIISPTLSLSARLSSSSIYNQLGPKGTYVVKGDIKPEYIRGSKKYKGADIDEIKDFAKSNPERFATGVGASIAGAALVGSGLTSMIKPIIKKAGEGDESSMTLKEKYSADIEKTAGIGTTVAKGAAGVGLLAASKNALLGKKRIYHGTSADNWENIKNVGFQSNFGGNGVSAMNDNLAANSKGNVYVAAARPVAVYHAAMGSRPEKFEVTNVRAEINREKQRLIDKYHGKKMPAQVAQKIESLDSQQKRLFRAGRKEFYKGHFLNPGDAKIIKADIDYDTFKNMETDYDFPINKAIRDTLGEKGDLLAKQFAAKGPYDIGPEQIHGSNATLSERTKHTLSSLPAYIKENPARFAGGAVAAGTGTALIANTIKGAIK